MLITVAMDRTAGLASLYLSMRGQGRCCELIETSMRPKKWCLVICLFEPMDYGTTKCVRSWCPVVWW